MRAQPLCSLAFLLLASSAAAIEPAACHNGSFLQTDNLSLARVTGKKGAKAFFYSTDTGAPGAASSPTSAYVLPGDEVLVNQTAEGWVCAWYSGKKTETVGWLKAGQVEILPAPAVPALRDWVGTWRFYGDSGFLKIAAAKDEKLAVSGRAVWHGGLAGQVEHSGRMKGTAAPSGNHLVIPERPKEDACIVRLTLLDRYLAAVDNQRCGGMNVTFTSVYTK